VSTLDAPSTVKLFDITLQKGNSMKTLLALGCISACVLLTGCGDSGTTEIQADQIRPTGEAVPPPGAGVKLGSNDQNAPSAKPKGE
jgi:hypothetical protein